MKKSIKKETEPISKENVLKEMLERKKQHAKTINELEKEIYKYETLFLEVSQGYPITKTLDYYLTNRSMQKKTTIKESDRIFSNIISGNH